MVLESNDKELDFTKKAGCLSAACQNLVYLPVHQSELHHFPGLSGLHGSYAIRTHHLVILMLNNVAMPDELASLVELRSDAGNFTRIGGDRILEAALPGFGRSGIPNQTRWGLSLAVRIRFECLTVHNFKCHFVDVHRVRIRREIVKLPDFSIAHIWVLGDRLHPHLMHRYTHLIYNAQHSLGWSIPTGH